MPNGLVVDDPPTYENTFIVKDPKAWKRPRGFVHLVRGNGLRDLLCARQIQSHADRKCIVGVGRHW